MLETDHRGVERLLGRLGDSDPGPERDRLVTRLADSLAVHMRFEEEALYPVLAGADSELAEEAEIEHGLAREGLARLRQLTAAPGFGAALDMIEAGIAHHVEEEEHEA